MYFETKQMTTTSFALGRVAKLTMMAAMVALTVSCSKKEAGEAKVGQSIASVNGEEITIHQLNSELQRANVQASQQEVAGKQLTKALIDRQILVQEAIKEKLDRNPNVMQALENAKAQLLAQAYLESKVAQIAKPTDTEISAYRSAHPDIFANRKVYVMDEIAFLVDPSKVAELQALSNTAKTLDDVKLWLDTNQVKHNRTQAAHAAESVPAELLSKFSKMVAGDLIFVNGNGRTLAARMIEIKDMPIAEKDSKPLIERILLGEKRKQVAEAEMARLRGLAKIEYINKKFDPSTDVTPAAAQTATPPVTSETKPSVAAPAVAAGDKSLEKGLSGL